ncbi:MAG: hypothetical protein JRD89_09125 [Deltaproteobacteria bacterium]|nr:hypothetical protein [Deltaproteobacteria bacterium]
MNKQQLYYLLDCRAPVGNSALWWRPDSKGYTCNLEEAGLYTEEQAGGNRETDIPIPREIAAAATAQHVRFDTMQQWAKQHLPSDSGKSWQREPGPEAFDELALQRLRATVAKLELQAKGIVPFKLRYGAREQGWAHDIGNGHAIIGNIPFTHERNYLDVVEYVMVLHGGIPSAGKRVARAYAHKTEISYPCRQDAAVWYAQLRDACQEEGWAIEGAYDGLCYVCHHAHPPLLQVLAQAGIDVRQLTQYRRSE